MVVNLSGSPAAEQLSALEGKHAVVLGGAGFLGSHLCTRLIHAGAQVTCIDNMITGDPGNVEHLFGRLGFRMLDYDVTDYLHVSGRVDYVVNFASPASPVDYLRWPIHTLKVGALGTHRGLGVALHKGATFLLASTSEVYGDPLVSPQSESYWGNVNPVGPRGVYDEAKRFAEALTLAYHRQHEMPVRIARIFNSILADEQVLYDDGSELRREPVSRLAERLGAHSAHLESYTVPAFAADGRIAPREATALVGHPVSQPCFEVRTRYGRSIRVTGDHSLFARAEDGSPRARPVSQLRVNDAIAIARHIHVPIRDRYVVDLTKVWSHQGQDPWALRVRHESLGRLAWRRRQEIFDLVADTTIPTRPFPSTVWSQVWAMSEENELPLQVIRLLGLLIPFDATVRVNTEEPTVGLPAMVPISNEMLWLIGLIVAQGCIQVDGNDSLLRISANEMLLDRAAKILERDLGLIAARLPTVKEQPAELLVCSRLLLLVLDELGLDIAEKRIPGWVLSLPASRLGWFIEGYRQGNSVHPDETLEGVEAHEFSTTSTSLKDDLLVGLARFGLVPAVDRQSTLGERSNDGGHWSWRLSVDNLSPWSPLDWHRGVVQHLDCDVAGDLVWAPVTGIEEIPATSLAYDFCVPGYENFWAGTGVMAHNTYGPRMRARDGRAVPAFFTAALENRPLPVHGDGSQTRSLCYVDDLIEGILHLLLTDYPEPVNLGNPEEVTVLRLAELVQEAVGSYPGVEYLPRPVDDPTVRRPDTSLALDVLGWKPQLNLRQGLEKTVPWFRQAVLGK